MSQYIKCTFLYIILPKGGDMMYINDLITMWNWIEDNHPVLHRSVISSVFLYRFTDDGNYKIVDSIYNLSFKDKFGCSNSLIYEDISSEFNPDHDAILSNTDLVANDWSIGISFSTIHGIDWKDADWYTGYDVYDDMNVGCALMYVDGLLFDNTDIFCECTNYELLGRRHLAFKVVESMPAINLYLGESPNSRSNIDHVMHVCITYDSSSPVKFNVDYEWIAESILDVCKNINPDYSAWLELDYFND